MSKKIIGIIIFIGLCVFLVLNSRFLVNAFYYFFIEKGTTTEERIHTAHQELFSDKTDEAGLRFIATTVTNASTTQHVSLDGCVSMPLSVKVRYGEYINFTNKGSTTVSVFLCKDREFMVKSLEKYTISSTLITSKTNKPGSAISIIPFYCKNSISAPIGFISIIK